MPLDAIDQKILLALQSDPELSISDLAQQIGMSTTPCWRRVKRLKAEGIIIGRAMMFDAKALGLMVSVFANIRLKQHDEATLQALEADVCQHPEIVECFSVSGESDYIVRVVTASIESYEAFLKKVLLHLPGVASINSCFALGCVKNTTALPI